MYSDKEWLLKEKYNGQKSEAFLADCARLEAGEPLAYVIGWTPFLNCKIWLDSNPPISSSVRHQKFLSEDKIGGKAKQFAFPPLIPRPETEYWVEKAIALIQQKYAPDTSPRVLDLCAGSGCIGVAVAKALPYVKTDFAELDATHHPTTEKNLHENCPQNTTVNSCIFGGDLFAEIPADTKYDFILSNPPYIDPALDRTESSVKDYEPHQALYGGEAGMELLTRIIAEAPTYLSPEGQLWLEHEPEQSQSIVALGTQAGFKVEVYKDQYQVERYSQLVLQ
jgi:release factor glutamine methyltransferase